jgi:L-asparaginase
MRRSEEVTTSHRVLLLTTGGTIGMIRNPDGGLSPCRDANLLLERVPELDLIARVDLLAVANVDSSNLQPELWRTISRAIYERMEDYDGFVVTHGTDTLPYTSAALSLMLQELPKPVVVTGAQLPLDDIGTDARSNLINAFRVATSDIAEVVVVFGAEIIRGTRAKKISVFDMQAITTVKDVSLGSIGLFIKFTAEVKPRSARRVLHQPFLNENVCRIGIYPGFKPEILEYLSTTHAGIVLEGFGGGNIPTEEKSIIPAIKAATARNVPIVVCTPCIIGSTQMRLYHVGRAALEAGAIPAMDMTPETTLVKLMWVLGQTSDLPTVASMMEKSFTGELEEVQ